MVVEFIFFQAKKVSSIFQYFCPLPKRRRNIIFRPMSNFNLIFGLLFELEMRNKPVDSIILAQVVNLSNTGLHHIQSSKELNGSRHCVQNVIKKFKETGQYNDRKWIVRPRKILSCSIQQLKRLMKEERYTPQYWQN